MLSAKYGHACVVKQLLDAGADPLARNQFSASALHWVRLDSVFVLGGRLHTQSYRGRSL